MDLPIRYKGRHGQSGQQLDFHLYNGNIGAINCEDAVRKWLLLFRKRLYCVYEQCVGVHWKVMVAILGVKFKCVVNQTLIHLLRKKILNLSLEWYHLSHGMKLVKVVCNCKHLFDVMSFNFFVCKV